MPERPNDHQEQAHEDSLSPSGNCYQGSPSRRAAGRPRRYTDLRWTNFGVTREASVRETKKELALKRVLIAISDPEDIGILRRRQEMEQYVAEREARVQNLMDLVDYDLRRKRGFKSHRGARRAVVCLTETDPTTGGHPIFRSATEAGRSIDRAPDNICQGIRRRGECGGKRWAYVDQLHGGKVVETGDGQWCWVWTDPAAREAVLAAFQGRIRHTVHDASGRRIGPKASAQAPLLAQSA